MNTRVASTTAIHPSEKPLRILVVDDERGILQLYQVGLGKFGMVTTGARDGQEGIECLQNTTFDAVICDINMPGYGGLEFLKGTRSRYPDLPVIMITGRGTADVTTRALALGATRCLSKPITPAVLREAIELATGRRRTSAPASPSPEAPHPQDAKAAEIAQRRGTRFDLSGVQAMLELSEDKSFGRRPVSLLDVSLGGALIEIADPTARLEVGALVKVATEVAPGALRCQVMRTERTLSGQLRAGLKFRDETHPEYSTAKCALLATAILQSASVAQLGRQVGDLAALVVDATADYAKLEDVLAKHAALSDRIRELAAKTTAERRIADIAQAIRILGFRTTVNAALVALVAPMLQTEQSARAFWVHSIATGLVAEETRSACGFNVSDAFAAGFLHDIGYLVLARAFPLEVQRLMEHSEKPIPSRELELEYFALTHEHVNSLLCRFGSFPPGVVEAMTSHHELSSTAGPAALLTRFANDVVEAYDDGIPPPSVPLPHPLDERRSATLYETLEGEITRAAVWYGVLIEEDVPIRAEGTREASKPSLVRPLPSLLTSAAASSTPPTMRVDVSSKGSAAASAQASHLEATSNPLIAQLAEGAAAFVRARPVIIARAIPTVRIPTKIEEVARCILDAEPKLQSYLAEAAKHLVADAVLHWKQVGDLARATLFVAETLARAGAVDEPHARAAIDAFDDLAVAAEPLARRGVLDATALNSIRMLRDTDLPQALASIVDFYRASAEKIAGRTIVTPDDLTTAKRAAIDLQSALAARAIADDVRRIEGVLERAAAAMVVAYDECRRGLSYIRWHAADADRIAPPLTGIDTRALR